MVMRASIYMHWAKTHPPAKYNLATSGVLWYPISELGVSIEDLEINGTSLYGYPPLQEALASKCSVPPECVVAATGTSMANHLVLAAHLNAGDEVLIEHPAYEPLLAVAEYLGATIKRFNRAWENAFQIDVDEIRRIVTSKTRLIVITNLHNPSSAFTDTSVLSQIGGIARETGAKVLVDEVYLETLERHSSAFLLGNEFLCTGSLTKAYGLSGLRCGWILADPEIAQKIWRLNDLYGSIPAHPAERLSVIALQKLPQIALRARTLLETNRVLLNEFLDGHPQLQTVRSDSGTVVFPRLSSDAGPFCRLLQEKYETSVVPGHYFDMPNHFRLGIGCSTDTLKAGLERISQALNHRDTEARR